MTEIAVALFAIGLVSVTYGGIRRRTTGRVANTPLSTTGAVATLGERTAGPAGTVSVEGALVCAHPLLSPATGTPCLYYELDVTGGGREAEYVRDRGAANFALDDGTGPVPILAEGGGELELYTSLSEVREVELIRDANDDREPIMFGSYAFDSAPGRGAYTLTCVERIIPVPERLYANGMVRGAALRSSRRLPLIISSESRCSLLGSSTVASTVCLAGGSASAALGVILGVVANITT